MVKDQDLAYVCIRQRAYMRDNGLTIIGMEGGWNATPMVTNTKVISKIISHTAKEFIHGLMAKFTRVSGKSALKKAKVSGRAFLVTRILESGPKVKQMGMVSISGRTEIDTKENGNFV
jgi:hypothetical protein